MTKLENDHLISIYVSNSQCWTYHNGQTKKISKEETLNILREKNEILICNKSLSFSYLGVKDCVADVYDILGLFGFVKPAQFCVPNVEGLAQALDWKGQKYHGWQAEFINKAIELLLDDLASNESKRTLGIAEFMGRGGWLWYPLIVETCKGTNNENSMQVWKDIKNWKENHNSTRPINEPINVENAVKSLERLVDKKQGEKRDGQKKYLEAICQIFDVYDKDLGTKIVVAEGETGIGKTLGYLVPSELWAEANDSEVWISTYSRYLQTQIEAESKILVSKQKEDNNERKVVVRQGRENYLCLLNYEDAIYDLSMSGRRMIALGYVARWLEKTKDGNIKNGDFPTWLATIDNDWKSYDGLSDRRGMCVFSSCPHYRKCFIERSQRIEESARIVVSNHTLSLLRLANLNSSEDVDSTTNSKQRIIFDEAHHIFDVADKVFATKLSVVELSYIRSWLLGRERSSGRLARGLRARIGRVADLSESITPIVSDIENIAEVLPTSSTLARLDKNTFESSTDKLFAKICQLVWRLNESTNQRYSQEISLSRNFIRSSIVDENSFADLLHNIIELGTVLLDSLKELETLSFNLLAELKKLRANQSDAIDENGLWNDLNGIIRSLDSFLVGRFVNMIDLLSSLLEDGGDDFPDDEGVKYIDRAVIERSEGTLIDVGLVRNFIDPCEPLIGLCEETTSGLAFTSATMQMKRYVDVDDGWNDAKNRLGLRHCSSKVEYFSINSPFDYSSKTKLLMIEGLPKGELSVLGHAFGCLMQASRGGALGLFTALERMRLVVPMLRDYLSKQGLELYVQHLDRMSTADLVRIFEANEDACLVGSDALRDGLDVSGRSLRMVIFERLPWPRPDILHRKRRQFFRQKHYDTIKMGQKMRQAYGRLIRSQDDKGIMIVLEGSIPSVALSSFPRGVEPQVVNLGQATEIIKQFLR